MNPIVQSYFLLLLAENLIDLVEFLFYPAKLLAFIQIFASSMSEIFGYLFGVTIIVPGYLLGVIAIFALVCSTGVCLVMTRGIWRALAYQFIDARK